MAVTSVLVYAGHLDMVNLYHSIIYYTITASPGNSCSKLFNMLLTYSFTQQVRDPFRRLPTNRWMKTLRSLCIIVVFLHLGDALAAILLNQIYCNDTGSWQCGSIHLQMSVSFNCPGLPSMLALMCYSKLHIPEFFGSAGGLHNKLKWSRCDKRNGEIYPAMIGSLILVSGIISVLVPVSVVLVCMALQIKHLRRSFQDRETETSPLLPDPSRHVCVTVFIVSVLFSLCHLTFFVLTVVVYGLSLGAYFDPIAHDDKFPLRMGEILGLTEYILPLLYAVAYPIIIICRKRELRERFVGYLRRVSARFRRSRV